MDLSSAIDLEFNRTSFILLLNEGMDPDNSEYSHKQIVEWCEKFWYQYMDIDAPDDIGPLLPVLTDIDAQWDLYLVNTYKLEQLQELNFELVVLPVDWFKNWLNKIDA